MPHRNFRLTVTLELRDILGYRVFQGDPAGFDKLHNAGCGSNNFGEGCQVEYRIDCHRLKGGDQRPMAESLAIKNLFVLTDEDHGARQIALPDGFLYEIINPAELCDTGEIGGIGNWFRNLRDLIRRRSNSRICACDD